MSRPLPLPKSILLLRHAEQPEDSDDLDLTAAGRKRALKLAVYIPKTFGRQDFVYAAAPNRYSVRAYVTMQPLCHRTGLFLDGSVRALAFKKLADRLLYSTAKAGTAITVCWTHTELPGLARTLGVREKDFPAEWDEAVYNPIYRLDYTEGRRPTVQRIIQPF